MTRDQLNRMFRKALLGMAATPLVALPGCGRSFPYDDELALIRSREDAGPRDAGHDGGFLRPDAGRDGGVDAGQWILRLNCTFNGGDSGFPLSECTALCSTITQGQTVIGCTPTSGNVLLCSTFCGVGRLASGVAAICDGEGLGLVLADMAAHEAAAVIAFEQLARELDAHGLDRSFGRGALRAAEEERRHARAVGALATRHQGRFALIRANEVPLRSVEELAFDNAVEGCVRETFGSLVGGYQAIHATNPAIRSVMANVSADEVGHGAWSWELARQLEQRLPVVKRRQAREASEEALRRMSMGMLEAVPREQHAALGLPDEERLETIATALRDQLI